MSESVKGKKISWEIQGRVDRSQSFSNSRIHHHLPPMPSVTLKERVHVARDIEAK